uniref:Uncharacterized protein n=1 Tax=Anguilla anguilla TaxID=7936 RepID=A0A0E9W1P6_ANGAN
MIYFSLSSSHFSIVSGAAVFCVHVVAVVILIPREHSSKIGTCKI